MKGDDDREEELVREYKVRVAHLALTLIFLALLTVVLMMACALCSDTTAMIVNGSLYAAILLCYVDRG